MYYNIFPALQYFFMGTNTQPEVVVIRNSLLNVIITLLREYLTSHVPGLEKHTKKNSQAVPIGKLQIPDVASFLPKHVITTYYQHNTRWTIDVID